MALAGNLCQDCCEVSHGYVVVRDHVDGQVIANGEICSEDGFSDVSYVELLGEGAALA